MSRFSKGLERIVYRFILSMAVGFFTGSYLIIQQSSNDRMNVDINCNERMSRSLNSNKKGNSRLDIEKGTLYVGMLSKEEHVNTHMRVISDTWAKHQNIRLEVFSGSNGTKTVRSGKVKNLKSGIRIIQLAGVSDVMDSTPKKSFAMLKYIHDNHLNNFDWFIWAQDDMYMELDELVTYLSRLDSTKPYYIGHTGRRNHAIIQEEGDFCTGEHWIVLSHEVLRRIGPNLKGCLGKMYTNNEDEELGRCIDQISGTKCTTWDATSVTSLKASQQQEQFRFPISFNTNKKLKYQYKQHQSALNDKIKKIITKITKMETELKKIASLESGKHFDSNENSHAGYVWDYTKRKKLYSSLFQVSRTGLATREMIANNMVSTLPQLRKIYSLLQSSKIEEVYSMGTRYFVSPLTSMEIISKLRVRFIFQKKTATIYINGLHSRRSFPQSLVSFKEETQLNFQTLGSQFENAKQSKKRLVTGWQTRVNFVMALSGRAQNLVRFLQNFKDAFLLFDELVSLTVVYFPHQTQDVVQTTEHVIDVDDKNLVPKSLEPLQFVLQNLNQVKKDFPESDINFLPVDKKTPFSRGLGLQMGAERIQHEDTQNELLFFCDVDLIFKRDILAHIRRSTIEGEQVYYPTFFSQYDPRIVYAYQRAPNTHFYFEEIAGFWRTFSYGMISIYKSDFMKTGGFDLSIVGWGLEDLKLCESVLTKAGLRVFKSNEPAIVHLYHDKDCPDELSQKQSNSCKKSRSQHFGPNTYLYYLWNDRNNTIDD